MMATCRDLEGGMQSRCCSAQVMLGQSHDLGPRGGAQNSSSSSPIDTRLCGIQISGSRSQLRDISHCSNSSSYREKTQSRESSQLFVIWVECWWRLWKSSVAMAANIFGSDASWVSPALLFIVIEIPLKASLLRVELLWTREVLWVYSYLYG